MGDKMIPAFCLTAGLGSRLAPHTQTRAKPCLPFIGAPLFAFSYYLCHRSGFQNFLFNLHHLPEQVEKTIRQTLPFNSSLRFMDERAQLLGSGGALWNARSELEKHPYFLVANGDEVLIPEDLEIIEKLHGRFLKEDPLATLLVTDHPDLLKTLKAVWVDRYHQVVGFGMDSPHEDALPVHYTGYKLISSRIFEYMEPGESNIFYEIFMKAMAQGERVTTHHCNELHWYETGDIASYMKALSEVLKLLDREDRYLLGLLRTFGFNPREWVYEEKDGHQLLRHRDTFIPHNCQLEGVVFIGKGVKVGIKGFLKNVVAENGVTVADNAQWENTFILKDAPSL